MKKNQTLASVSLSVVATAWLSTQGATAQYTSFDDLDVETNRNLSSAAGDVRANVDAFLETNGESLSAISSLVQVQSVQGRNGRRHLRYEQQIDGRRVMGSVLKASVERDGTLITVSRRLADTQTVSSAQRGPATDALKAAIAATFGSQIEAPSLVGTDGAVTSFANTSFFHQSPTAEEVFIVRDGVVEPGWLIETWSQVDNMLYHTQVDAAGQVVEVELRTSEDRYNVFRDHPIVSNQEIEEGVPNDDPTHPYGWIFDGLSQNEPSAAQYTTYIRGNNVYAYLDRDNDSNPNDDVLGPQVLDGNFDAVANLSQSPLTQDNQETAVQNLFWLNNFIHDELYKHGFVETARNFQYENFGRGGAHRDPVLAEAQDGGGTNNANFATPPDGRAGRMQMYIWTITNPDRDGDLDSDIVWHEYGHGLTWRMIGNMSGSAAGAVGEGVSDALALIMNDQPTVGEYSTNNFFRGIRSAPYDAHPDTLTSFNSSRGVHRNGELYAATMWLMRELYYGAGYDRDDLMGDMIQGMNFTAPGPDYLDMRNGILDAAPADRDCLVWEAFASKGMGEGAVFSVFSQTESFDVPAVCDGPPSDNEVLALSAAPDDTGDRWRTNVTVQVATPGTVIEVDWSALGSNQTCVADDEGICLFRRRFDDSIPSVDVTVVSLDGAPATAADGVPLEITVVQPTLSPPPPPPPPTGNEVLALSAAPDDTGDRWRTNVTVQVTDPGTVIEVDWSLLGTNQTCVADASGICLFRRRFDDSFPSVDVQVVSLDGVPATAAEGVPLQITVEQPSMSPPPPPPPPSGNQVLALSAAPDDTGDRWRSNVTIQVTEPGTVIEVDWSTLGSNQSCVADASGICLFRRRFDDSIPSVDVTVVTLDGEAAEAADGVPLQITVNQP
ncbi:MAG: hypothetical protein HRU11_04440 [Parvularculaceae bacterium]|nr:hypothetical protein [Parvularculaceae bacterium]